MSAPLLWCDTVNGFWNGTLNVAYCNIIWTGGRRGDSGRERKLVRYCAQKKKKKAKCIKSAGTQTLRAPEIPRNLGLI